jgi:hypothetical protein
MPTKKQSRPYRLRITEHGASVSYIVRRPSGEVRYLSRSEMPLALSNLVQGEAAELRFQLEDALDGSAAARAVRVAWQKAFRRAPGSSDLGVEVL